MQAATWSLAPAGRRVAVIEQSCRFYRRVPTDGRDLQARARVIHDQENLLHASAELTDADGNRVALAGQMSLLSDQSRRPGAAGAERILATVLFTDIVGSTEAAERLGDTKWGEVLAEHHALVRRQLATFRGREVKTLGDGFLVSFDSPTRGVQCARAIRDGVRRLGIDIRAGLHTGECDVVGPDLAGIAVHIASRVQASAAPGEVLVSSTVRDATAGSGLCFVDRGRHRLKGIDGEWHLLSVAD
jgi:class 3 adenylate cyclase